MDPVSQAVLGAAAAQAAFGRRLGRTATACGVVGGMLADADVVIRSAADPLVAMEYHRHFTHALVFVPVGGLLAALPFLLTRAGRRRWRAVLGASTIAYATHAPLDALTSYGTLLFWPFSRERIALDWLSIIDPLFTLPLLALVVAAWAWQRPRFAAAGLLFAAAWAVFGAVQHARATAVQVAVAASRGHRIEHGRTTPTLGNLVLWRSVYVAGGALWADAVRVAPFGRTAFVPGESVLHVVAPTAPAGVDPERAARDFARFAWFADGLVARHRGEPTVLADMRYSLRTEGFEPLWGIRFLPSPAPPRVEWVELMLERRDGFGELWSLLRGASDRLVDAPG